MTKQRMEHRGAIIFFFFRLSILRSEASFEMPFFFFGLVSRNSFNRCRDIHLIQRKIEVIDLPLRCSLKYPIHAMIEQSSCLIGGLNWPDRVDIRSVLINSPFWPPNPINTAPPPPPSIISTYGPHGTIRYPHFSFCFLFSVPVQWVVAFCCCAPIGDDSFGRVSLKGGALGDSIGEPRSGFDLII